MLKLKAADSPCAPESLFLAVLYFFYCDLVKNDFHRLPVFRLVDVKGDFHLPVRLLYPRPAAYCPGPS